MGVKSKIKFRAYAFIAAGFVVLIFIVGITYAFLAALLAFLLWNAYQWMKMLRFWNSQSVLSRQIVEYITAHLNEGDRSSNLWVKSLTLPEMKDFALTYRVELMARNAIIEKESANLIEGWTEWGSTRIDENVLQQTDEVLNSNIGSEEKPIRMKDVLIEKGAFETLVAEYALKLLGVDDPRSTICQRFLKRQLEEINALRT